MQVAYFDQMRDQLDLSRSVGETISPGSDWVEVNGERKHVTSYLADFLFSPQRAGTPVAALSGGERNRLLLARLFARPANVLVLDEPTNDLDIESLDLLETAIQTFPGTLLLVSHDRAFVDNVVTQTLAPLGDGRWKEYVGGYTDWLAQRPQSTTAADGSAQKQALIAQAPKPSQKVRLSYKEQRELDILPADIETLEAEQKAISERLSQRHQQTVDPQTIAVDGKRLTELESIIQQKLERWSVLEAKVAK